ncbi:hypothetical protein DAPPUDRAFT_337638, partial [Daphnia pulex]
MSGPKYVSVYWEQEKKFTTQKISCVRNPSQLKNSKLVDDVEHQGREKDKLQNGWQCFPGRIIAIGAKKKTTEAKGFLKYQEITAAEREGGKIAGTQSVLDSSSAESDSSSSSTCYDNIPSTFFESQLQAKLNENIPSSQQLQSKDKAKAKIPSTTSESQLQSKDKTKKASKSARVSDGDSDVEELQFKAKTEKASRPKSATAELSDGDSDSDLLSREELLLKLKKVNKEKKALEKENEILRRNNIILQK